MEIAVAFGKNRSELNWKNEYITWEEFVQKLSKVRRTAETMAEYDRMDNNAKGKIKDGPAFVGGSVQGGRRKKENVESRSLITLDVDSADDDFLFMLDLVLGGTAHVLYSTHSHRPAKKKYRLVLPVTREMDPDEYAAVSRKLAEDIGMPYFDKTTFDVHRLMYMPSCSKDAKPEMLTCDGELFDVDAALATYADWRDPIDWPRHPGEERDLAAKVSKLRDAGGRPGVIGAFCRTYGVQEGIEKFLPDVYEPTGHEDRWTFSGGTSIGGLRIYDDGHAYSEHQSDPANDGHCHNIFDLVRIHKFEESNDAMMEFAAKDPAVKKHMMEEEFGDVIQDDAEDDAVPWITKLKTHPKNPKVILPTAGNAEIILSHGAFQGVLAYDAFRNMEAVRARLPWRERERPTEDYEPWLGADDRRLRHYFGKTYGIKSADVIMNAFTEVVHQNKFHPVKEYLEAQVWDGKARINRLFVDYLGADDNAYVREATRKMIVAAVARIYEPGVKFDYMLVLVGPQGVGKSTILQKLGRQWFSDSLKSFDTKEAGEHLQSAWIFEFGELAAMKKAEVDEIKQFITKRNDKYRVAYDRTVTDFPRKCVFFGTTNNLNFLKDPTGNRRFWPVTVNPAKRTRDVFSHFTEEEIGQVWAEALSLHRGGETLTLSADVVQEADRIQEQHMEGDPREGLVHEYLETPIDEEFLDDDGGALRTRVCASQIWEECLGKKLGDMKPWDAKDICDILRRAPGWEERKGRVKCGRYGKQTVFERGGQ